MASFALRARLTHCMVRPVAALAATVVVSWFLAPVASAHVTGGRVAPASHVSGDPDLGPNVYVFDPSMSTASIHCTTC